MKKDTLIYGDKIFLRPMEEKDAPFIVKWRNDPDIKKWMFSQEELTIESHLLWFKNKNNHNRIDYIICDRKNEKPIGTVNFSNIENKTAEAGKILGNKDYWGRGIATEALLLWLNFGFNEIGLNLIHTRTMQDNFSSIKVNEKIGFRMAKREVIDVNNTKYDIIIMEIKKQDFK